MATNIYILQLQFSHGSGTSSPFHPFQPLLIASTQEEAPSNGDLPLKKHFEEEKDGEKRGSLFFFRGPRKGVIDDCKLP